MSIRSVRLLGLGLLGFACLHSMPASSQDPARLRVLSSNGVRAAIEDMQPVLEQALGQGLDIEFSTAAALARRIESGEPFDVAILTPALIDALIEQQKISADSKSAFARTGVGVGARAGSTQANLSSPEGLRELLLEADSVAFTAEGQSRAAIDATFERLGIVEAMREKSVLLGPGQAPGAVVAGQAELVLTLISEIVPVDGLELLGPLPADMQSYVTFAAGLSAMTHAAAAARSLLEELLSPAMTRALETQGLERSAP